MNWELWTYVCQGEQKHGLEFTKHGLEIANMGGEFANMGRKNANMAEMQTWAGNSQNGLEFKMGSDRKYWA
ncbi:hypothetical protein [Lentibacillus sp. CBA3610]|uniref:hypothetical protein n=1 Tax=Lentibacillus sp. CBA3610 TaxID=2518176 RepID=UPI001595E3F3|nr:hypothetical protein [Lentibacillus sp. CBA3610]QKY70475.1 hypothetical protein Len3610_13520 [Lentibacillus sp. CBA3610]